MIFFYSMKGWEILTDAKSLLKSHFAGKDLGEAGAFPWNANHIREGWGREACCPPTTIK
jgi:hypothetical protein